MPDFRVRPTFEGVNLMLATENRRTLGWYIDGVSAVASAVGPVHILDQASTLLSVRAFAVTAPTGSAFDFDIKYYNVSTWTTIFSTRPTIAAAANSGGSGAVFSTTAIPADGLLRLDVIAANAAAYVTISLRLRTP